MILRLRDSGAHPELVTESRPLLQSALVWFGITAVMLAAWWLRGHTPAEWPLVATPLTVGLVLAIAAGAVARKPRRTRPLVIVGLVGFVLALGGILALALPFF
ncbi:MAG TPA: hypothetical protein PLK46_07110 [Propioniciclava sp.]|jgi:uncharacterized membrane protein|uniref:hypothetical protein n=1 Tax=Propioniciclava sp. TaxID=2038686 RepID=UPI002CE5CD6F|nr:hypothetical protein [Propioniciclava sp.]HRL48914.1 hypothetical protein [Propioniciclava sp.]HRL80083.1 hypothetical protein [Propioniciclava sp.]